MSPLILIFLKSAAYPAVAAAILLFLFGNRREPWRSGLQALILAAAFVSGFYVLLGNPHLFPRDVNESLVWCALLLMGFVWVAPQSHGVRYVLRAIFTLVIQALVLWHIRDSVWNWGHWRLLVAFYCLMLGVWSITERAARDVQPLTVILLPLVTATALSFALLLSGSALLAQLVSIWCALLAGAAAIALGSSKRLSLAAVVPFASVMLATFMTIGLFYLDVRPWRMILLCLPFGLLWIRKWIPGIPKTPVGEALTLALIGAVPLADLIWHIYQAGGPLY